MCLCPETFNVETADQPEHNVSIQKNHKTLTTFHIHVFLGNRGGGRERTVHEGTTLRRGAKARTPNGCLPR